MRNLLLLLVLNLFLSASAIPQILNGETSRDKEPVKMFMNSHDPGLKTFPEKSFYQQKKDWQYIIDTTWGPGLPLAQKQQIFNTYISNLDSKFDGFQSLGMTWNSWDSLKNYYYSKIDSTTSRGRFCAIMQYLCSKLRDAHTYCDDNEVLNTFLNPGVPLFIMTGYVNAAHVGVVTTVLPDSSVLVLRTVNNHPLNLEPGDIILGYEGVPWRDLIVEIMDAELPNYDLWGGYERTFTDHLFIGAGMNWHLFETMDVLKYSTGDTVHLSVAPLANINIPPMLNNEQMEIPGIQFPDYFNGEIVTYGILNNTNIGYIYVLSEWPITSAEIQFKQAVTALQNTDALIIDMRWNEGGYALWQAAFNILANETIYTLEDAIRCSPSNFNLCPINNQSYFKISGTGPTKYDRPIAVLVGPNCVSMGDCNAYRLSYLYNVRTFGKPTWASLGLNEWPVITGWTARLSTSDVFHINNPGFYLNRKEFPVDYPVWHTRDDAAAGKDAVVEKALDWINNLVYPHDTFTDKLSYSPEDDTVNLSTIIENPNTHQLSARAYLKTLEGTLIDSVELTKQTLKVNGENWTAGINTPEMEEYYKLTLTVFDGTTSDHITVPNAARFTTAGPVVLDSIRFVKDFFNWYNLKPFVTNLGSTLTITDAKIRLLCNDPWVSSIGTMVMNLPPIAPGESVGGSSWITIEYNDSTFPGYFNIETDIIKDDWILWTDSIQLFINPAGVEENNQLPLSYSLEQNYPNPFNPATKISWQSPVGSRQTIKVYDVLGNEITTLVDEYKPAGKYEVEFDASKLPSGVYFYQLRVLGLQSKDRKAGNFVQSKKMILLK